MRKTKEYENSTLFEFDFKKFELELTKENIKKCSKEIGKKIGVVYARPVEDEDDIPPIYIIPTENKLEGLEELIEFVNDNKDEWGDFDIYYSTKCNNDGRKCVADDLYNIGAVLSSFFGGETDYNDFDLSDPAICYLRWLNKENEVKYTECWITDEEGYYGEEIDINDVIEE